MLPQHTTRTSALRHYKAVAKDHHCAPLKSRGFRAIYGFQPTPLINSCLTSTQFARQRQIGYRLQLAPPEFTIPRAHRTKTWECAPQVQLITAYQGLCDLQRRKQDKTTLQVASKQATWLKSQTVLKASEKILRHRSPVTSTSHGKIYFIKGQT